MRPVDKRFHTQSRLHQFLTFLVRFLSSCTNILQTLKKLTDRAEKILTDRADSASVLTTKEAFGKKNRKKYTGQTARGR
nr:hypothetical protein [uncultured Cohaesibacter sp.]